MCTQIMAGVANVVAKWELAEQQIPTKFSEFWLQIQCVSFVIYF